MDPQAVMRARFQQERLDELKKELKQEKKYAVSVAVQFVGKFDKFVEEDGETYAVFIQEGVTDKGGIPYRKVKVNNIVATGIIKT